MSLDNKFCLEEWLSKYQLDKLIAICSILLVAVYLILTPFSNDDIEYFVNREGDADKILDTFANTNQI